MHKLARRLVHVIIMIAPVVGHRHTAFPRVFADFTRHKLLGSLHIFTFIPVTVNGNQPWSYGTGLSHNRRDIQTVSPFQPYTVKPENVKRSVIPDKFNNLITEKRLETSPPLRLRRDVIRYSPARKATYSGILPEIVMMPVRLGKISAYSESPLTALIEKMADHIRPRIG